MGATQHGRARYVNILINRTNVCGGVNKAGLASTIGPIANRLVLNCNTTCGLPKTCVIKKWPRMNYQAGRKYLG